MTTVNAICPAGQRLYRNGADCAIGGYRAIKFRAPASACSPCTLRAKCLRKPDTTVSRQFAVLARQQQATHAEQMRQRIDSDIGRAHGGRHHQHRRYR
jgi:hypothetical protein